MPDITMCASDCPVSGRCHRHRDSGTVPTDMLQSWAEFEPTKGVECSGFWSAAKDSKVSVSDVQRGPSPAELAGTPIIDDWQIVPVRNTDDGSIHDVVTCRVSGDSRWPDGRWVRTSTIVSIDSDRRWVVTQNTLYRLGCPHSEMPLIVSIACQPTWEQAWEHACASMGRHTVTEFVWKTATTLEADSVDWGRRRVRAAMVAEDLVHAGRGFVADAWRLLAVTDATDTNAVKIVYDCMCQVAGSHQTPRASDCIDGWGMMSIGETDGVDLSDPVAAAHKLGAARGNTPTDSQKFSGPTALELLKAALQESDEIGDVSTGVVVLAHIGGTSQTSAGKEVHREFKGVIGRRIPLAAACDIAAARTKLRGEFPHLHSAIDAILSDFREGESVRLRPTLLVGEPGGGKSRLARRLAEVMGIGLVRFDGAAAMDNTFGGTGRRWSTSEHCVPLEAIRRHMIANPWILIDEVDKAGTRRDNGTLSNSLIPFIEIETSRAYPDPLIQSDVNVSHVGYILTCNDDSGLPAPLRDRLRVVRLPTPALDHMILLSKGIVADIARENGGDERWYPDLDDFELAIVETLWPGGSVRRLRAVVERILARRESNPRN